MASPVAHTLIGAACGIGWFLPRIRSWREGWRRAAELAWPILGCVILSNACDLDYLAGIPQRNLNLYHQYYSHTLGWITLAAFAAWLILRRARPAAARGTDFLFFAAIGASHLIIDLLTEDSSAPLGIMAFWPFTEHRLYFPSLWLFLGLDKQTFHHVLRFHNLQAIAREIILTAPLLLLVLIWKRRAPSESARSRPDAP